MTKMMCDVCGTEDNIAGVASSSLGAISFCFCIRCLQSDIEPEFMFQFVFDTCGYDVAEYVRSMSTISDGKIVRWNEWSKTAVSTPEEYE